MFSRRKEGKKIKKRARYERGEAGDARFGRAKGKWGEGFQVSLPRRSRVSGVATKTTASRRDCWGAKGQRPTGQGGRTGRGGGGRARRRERRVPCKTRRLLTRRSASKGASNPGLGRHRQRCRDQLQETEGNESRDCAATCGGSAPRPGAFQPREVQPQSSAARTVPKPRSTGGGS